MAISVETEFEIKNIAPPADIFVAMRAQCGWGSINLKIAELSLSASILNVTVFAGETIVGFGRVVGDGAIYFYFQDIVVHENFRGQGIGNAIMKNLLKRLESIRPEGAMTGLMAATDKEPFYEALGFVSRPNATMGAGMVLIKPLITDT